LKATGWQAAFAFGRFRFSLIAWTGSFDLPSNWIALIVVLVMIVSAALAAVSDMPHTTRSSGASAHPRITRERTIVRFMRVAGMEICLRNVTIVTLIFATVIPS
jgi:hypothetical protein